MRRQALLVFVIMLLYLENLNYHITLLFVMVFLSMMLLYLENENYDVMLLSKLTSAEFQSCLTFSLLLLFKYKVMLQK